jgi:hypothetical protein
MYTSLITCKGVKARPSALASRINSFATEGAMTGIEREFLFCPNDRRPDPTLWVCEALCKGTRVPAAEYEFKKRAETAEALKDNPSRVLDRF